MMTHKPHAERPLEKGSAPRAFATADHITGTYPGGPSAGCDREARHQGAAIRGVGDVEALRERLVLRRRHRRRARHAIEVLILGLALALSTGAYLGFEAHDSPERATERVLEGNGDGNGDIDLSDEMRWLVNELWRMEDMERLPRR